DAADVLDSVGRGESEILVEAVTNVVTVEHIGVAAERVEALLDLVGNRGLAGAGESGEPKDARLLPLRLRTRRLVDVERLPADVVRPAQRKLQEAGADRRIGQPVDEDEAAEIAAHPVRLEDHRTAQLQIAYS